MLNKRPNIQWVHASLAALLAACLSLTVLAQSATGSLGGVVQDQSGAAVSGAKVTAASAETGLVRTATADAEGRWTLTVLPVGKY